MNIDDEIDKGLAKAKKAYKDPLSMWNVFPIIFNVSHESSDPYNVDKQDHEYPSYGLN